MGVKLQDGMVMTLNIAPQKLGSFFYESPKKTKDKFHALVSFSSTEQMKNAIVRLAYSSEEKSVDYAHPVIPQPHKYQPDPTVIL